MKMEHRDTGCCDKWWYRPRDNMVTHFWVMLDCGLWLPWFTTEFFLMETRSTLEIPCNSFANLWNEKPVTRTSTSFLSIVDCVYVLQPNKIFLRHNIFVCCQQQWAAPGFASRVVTPFYSIPGWIVLGMVDVNLSWLWSLGPSSAPDPTDGKRRERCQTLSRTYNFYQIMQLTHISSTPLCLRSNNAAHLGLYWVNSRLGAQRIMLWNTGEHL